MATATNDLQLSTVSKVLLFIFCSCAISSTALIFRKAEHNGISFNPIAASFFSEMMKVTVAVLLCLKSGVSFSQIRNASNSDLCAFMVPAFLYVLTNNLRYFIIQLVNPGIIGVMWNLKIVVVGILYQCPPFRRKLIFQQWIGIGLLVCGSGIADSSQWSVETDGVSNSGGFWGLFLLITGVFLASCSAVSCEYAYKSTSKSMDFSAQCLVLYFQGACLNFTAFILSDFYQHFHQKSQGENSSSLFNNFPKSLIEGFDVWAWAAVANISLVGFLIGLIFKYIDSIAQVFSDMTAMFLTAFLSWILFGLEINIEFIIALFICFISVLVYYGILPKMITQQNPEGDQGDDDDDDDDDDDNEEKISHQPLMKDYIEEDEESLINEVLQS